MIYLILFYIPYIIHGSYYHKFMIGYASPLACIFVFFASAAFHTFKCNSIFDYHLFLTLDLSGILIACIGGIYMNIYLEYTCYPIFRDYNVISATIFGILLVYPITPYLVKHRMTNLRTFLYMIFAFWSFIFLLFKIFYIEHGMYGEHKWKTLYIQLRFFFYLIISLVIRTLKFPERISQGRFNIVGASHQIFHIFVAFAIYQVYLAYLNLYLEGHFNYCVNY